MSTLDEIFPPFALRIACGPLSMAVLRDEDIPAIVDLVRAGIHDPDFLPFYLPWTLAPAEELPLNLVRYYWQQRSATSAERFGLQLVVRHEDSIVGMQDIMAANFAKTRVMRTGSWLGRAHQGRGIGTLMRQTVCVLGFDHLSADFMQSEFVVGNAASQRVSEKLGYRPAGTHRIEDPLSEGWREEARVLLAPGDFVRPAEPVRVEGAAELRTFLGL